MEITLELIVFTVLALFIGVSAILAVTTRRILRAATYLLFVLFGTAGIYFQLNYSFLGAVQLLIYAGGITVLYVFSILLTSSQGDKAEDLKGYKLFVGLGAALASLGNNFSLFLMILGVKDLMRYSASFQNITKHFRNFYRNRTNQYRLSLEMQFRHLRSNSLILADLRPVNHIRFILTNNRLIGRYDDDIHAINSPEFIFLRLCCTRHTSQLVIHTEKILEGNRCQGLRLFFNVNALFGLNSLMQPVTVATAKH